MEEVNISWLIYIGLRIVFNCNIHTIMTNRGKESYNIILGNHSGYMEEY